MSVDEPGSTQRAMLGWRTTATAMMVFWLPLPFFTIALVREGEGFQDLAFVLLVMLAYCAAVLAIIPAFTFTVGRWVDRRTAPRGLRRSVVAFGLCGMGFGLVVDLLLGPGALTWLGMAVLLLAPGLAAAAGRLLAELRGRVWSIVLWVTFALSVAVALSLIISVALAGR